MAVQNLLKFTPIRRPQPADQQALIVAMGQQLSLYQAGLPLTAAKPQRALAKPSAAGDMALNYQVWGLQYAPQSARVLTSYGAIADLFHQDSVDGRLLILGEPGMGKTHTLLAVGQLLLQRAGRGQGHVPVLIELSAWAGEPLRPWLIGYLWRQYRVAQSLAEGWLDQAQLTLLLDDFDHLTPDRQRTFAYALDTLLRSSPNQTILLCCRRRVMEETGITFGSFNSGVHIQPLAAQQVKDYIMAQNCPDLWPQIKASKGLQQLARFPLYLNMLVVMSARFGQGKVSIKSREALVELYLTHQTALGKAPQRQDLVYLDWLAQQLEHRSRWFHLDELDYTWLPSSQRLLYRLLVGLTITLIFGLVGGNFLLGLALGLVASQVDLESFPQVRLSLATRFWGRLGTLALVSSLLAVVFGVGLGSLGAVLLGRFNLALPAFGWGALLGAVSGWGLGLGFLLWGGLQNSIQIRRTPNQDMQLSLRNTTVLMGLLGLIITLLWVLPALIAGQPPLTLLPSERWRVLAASLISAILWLSFGLQHTLVRGLLHPVADSGWPLVCGSLLYRLVNQRLLRQGGGYCFGHEILRQGVKPHRAKNVQNNDRPS